jgi:hypothetical protein
MQVITKSGLKSVKCFGSSTTFSNQMKRIKGVTGVTTYVKTNTVKVMYNPAEIDTIAILKSIFTPVKFQIRKPAEEIHSLDVFRLRVDNFLDPLDAAYLEQLLAQEKNIYGFTTEFDCPVRVTVFADSSAKMEITGIKDIVEMKSLDQQLVNGKTLKIELRFKVTSIEKEVYPVSIEEFHSAMYYGYTNIYREGDLKSFSSYSILFPGGGTEATNLMLEKLSYHLSLHPGIIGIESALAGGKPMLTVYFDRAMTNDTTIYDALNSDQILSPGIAGVTASITNPLSFPFKGQAILK